MQNLKMRSFKLSSQFDSAQLKRSELCYSSSFAFYVRIGKKPGTQIANAVSIDLVKLRLNSWSRINVRWSWEREKPSFIIISPVLCGLRVKTSDLNQLFNNPRWQPLSDRHFQTNTTGFPRNPVDSFSIIESAREVLHVNSVNNSGVISHYAYSLMMIKPPLPAPPFLVDGTEAPLDAPEPPAP